MSPHPLHPHPLTCIPSGHLPHLGADASVPPGPHHHQLIRLPGRGGGEGGTAQSGCPASPPPPGSSLCPHSPPPGEGTDSPLSEATGSRVGLLRQGGAQGRGRRPNADREKGTSADRETEKHSKDPARGRDQAKRSPFTHSFVKCILGSGQSKAEQQRWGEEC